MNTIHKLIQYARSIEKPYLFIGFIAIVTVFLLLLSVFEKFPTLNNVPISSTPVPETVITPPPLNPIVQPKPGEVEIGNTRISITLSFDADIDLSTLHIESNPEIDFVINVLPSGPNQVVLHPKTPWRVGETYTITIRKGVTSVVTERKTTSDIILKYLIKAAPTPIYPQDYGI